MEHIREAIRLNPNFVTGPHLNTLGLGYLVAGKFREAIEAWERNVARGGPVRSVPAFWAAAYHQLGRSDDAKAARDRLLTTIPDFSIKTYVILRAFDPTVRERLAAMLREAGLPE